MQQFPISNSQKTNNKTVQALKILEKTNERVNSILKEINAGNAGYIKIQELFSQIQADIADAGDRADKETIRIGILGGTGSGKSTLANALMGDNILPDSAIIFCTSIPTTIRYIHQQYMLEVESELEKHRVQEKYREPTRMKDILRSICKESENPNNNKKIVKITIGVPAGILDGKEIVDVPGFTKGNPLHQAFAERYAKYYCDVCLVLINNSGSVEINSREGLEALAYAFQNRLDSTAFIVNKCDEGSKSDIDFIQGNLKKYLRSESLHLFRISSRNSLTGTGEHYDFSNLLGYLAFLSSRKTLVLVKALLERLIANFTSLRDLCHLTRDELAALHQDIKNLLNIEFDNLSNQLKNNISKDEIAPKKAPKINISAFDLPTPMGVEPYEYAKKLVDSLSSQSSQILDEYVQQYQAQIYRAFNSRFEEKLGEFNQDIQRKVNEFEYKFGISSSIQMPKVENAFKISNFNPSQIEKLKPPGFRLWAESILPEILVKDVKFWLSPISIEAGFFSLKLGVPIGLKRKGEMTFEMQKNIPEQAIRLMNHYLYESLNKFLMELNKYYKSVVTQFIDDWRKCLRNYLKQIEIAQVITEPASLKKVDDFVNAIRHSSEEIANLMSQD
jgi:energy-coupling factor transporter ATP-binding protein EcfA2